MRVIKRRDGEKEEGMYDRLIRKDPTIKAHGGVKRVLVERLFVHLVNNAPNILQVRRSPMKLSKMDKRETKEKRIRKGFRRNKLRRPPPLGRHLLA